MKTYMTFNEILKVALIRKLLNISLKNEISFVVLRSKKPANKRVFYIYQINHIYVQNFNRVYINNRLNKCQYSYNNFALSPNMRERITLPTN